MNLRNLETMNLTLVPLTREEVRARIERMPSADRAEVSPLWLERLEQSAPVDPWVHGFAVVRRIDGTTIGQCGFKGPPDAAGVVEIAYGIDEEHRGKGCATEAAAALVSFALSSGKVRTMRAHTLPEANASTRVLEKCGFRRVGEVSDPEDGLVWRWERSS